VLGSLGERQGLDPIPARQRVDIVGGQSAESGVEFPKVVFRELELSRRDLIAPVG